VAAWVSSGASLVPPTATTGAAERVPLGRLVPLPGATGLNGLSASVRAPFLADVARHPATTLRRGSPLDVSLVLRFRDEKRLSSLLAGLAARPRTERGGYLTNEAFDEEFGPSPASVAALSRYLRGQGVSVGRLEGLSLPLHGSAGVIERAFHTSFATAEHAYFTVARPELPSTLAAAVAGTVGFNSLPVAASNVVTGARVGRLRGASVGVDSGAPVAESADSPSDGPSTGAWNLDALGDTYGIGGLIADGDNGSGATVGVYELQPYDPDDVAEFDSYYNLASNVADPSVMSNGTSTAGASSTSNITDVSIPVAGSYFPVASTDASTIASNEGDTEADLDIEQVQSQAPDANIDVYGAENTGSGEWYEWMAMITPAAFVADSGTTPRPVVPMTPPPIITTSWGLCEIEGDSSGLDELFEEAAAQGQTILAASGDAGSEGCESDGQPELGLNYPSASPYVTAIGGTSNQGNGLESAWAPPNSEFSAGYGGGGGLSDVFAEPAWQDAVYPETASSSNPCSASLGEPSTCRASPDISANAGVGENVVAEGGWEVIGGTSAAAPLIAGLLADATTSCTTTGGHLVGGELAPEIDAADGAGGEGTDFTDITTGSNDATGQYGGGKYPATLGYDLATGVGVPIASGFSCPTITTMSEIGGSAGDSIVISGSNLENATIDFGGLEVPTSNATSTSVTVTVPSDQSANPDVAVTAATAFGVSGPASFGYGAYEAGPPATTTSTTTSTTLPPPSPPSTTTTTVAPPTTAPAAIARAGVSGFAPVRAAALHLSASSERVRVAADVIIRVQVPTRAATTVMLELRDGGRWRTLTRLIVSGGAAAVTLDFQSPGAYAMRGLIHLEGAARYSNVDHFEVLARSADEKQPSKNKKISHSS